MPRGEAGIGHRGPEHLGDGRLRVEQPVVDQGGGGERRDDLGHRGEIEPGRPGHRRHRGIARGQEAAVGGEQGGGAACDDARRLALAGDGRDDRGGPLDPAGAGARDEVLGESHETVDRIAGRGGGVGRHGPIVPDPGAAEPSG